MSGIDGRPIVVGVDGSASAKRAALWAAEHAVRHKVGLRLVHAI
ncbi:MAG TPA: universal stress protein, partial [Pseudonocardia sp.]